MFPRGIINRLFLEHNSNAATARRTTKAGSIPDAVRKRELLHAGCAPRTFARLIPRLDPVRRRDRTSRLEIHPLHARGSWEGEAIQSSLKTRRGGRRGLLR